MNLKINHYQILLEGLTKLGGNEENWKLQERIIKEIEKLERE